MSITDSTQPSLITPSLPSPVDQDIQREQLRRQLERRFRHNISSGQVSPLLHLVMRYKLENLL